MVSPESVVSRGHLNISEISGETPKIAVQESFDARNESSWANLEKLTRLLKRNTLETIRIAKAGHIGACCSSLELMSTLYFTDILQIDSANPKHPRRDYVLVRGHLGPLRYNIFQLLGWMEKEEMTQYRQFGSRLPGHEDMKITPGVDITPSGSLGMILSYAVGARLSFQNMGLENRVFCFLGDGEEQEGNVSEAARHAAHLQLDGLVCIIDKNSKQLSASTSTVDGKADLKSIWSGYGWTVLEIEDGHNLLEIYAVYRKATDEVRGPVCIVANTIKGNEIPGSEIHYSGYHVYHGADSGNKQNQIPIEVLLENLDQQLIEKKTVVPLKTVTRSYSRENSVLPEINIQPDPSEHLATSYDYLEEYLKKLAGLDLSSRIYVLTADYPPRNLVYDTGGFKFKEFAYYNIGVREQHLFSMINGMRQVEKDAILLVLCGDAFLYRHADQLNALAQAESQAVIYSVQAGLSGAKNGPTHQSSGQPGLVFTMPNIDFYEPSSKRDLFYCMNRALNEERRPVYIRTHMNPTPYDLGNFRPSSWYEVVETVENDCTVVASGMITLEALKAVEQLHKQHNISAKLVNVLSPKDLNGIGSVIENDKPLFTFYNGNPDVLASPIAVELLSTPGRRPSQIIPHGFINGASGSVSDLMRHLNLDAEGIFTLIKNQLAIKRR